MAETTSNKKFLGVQNPFYKKGFGRRRQNLMGNLGFILGVAILWFFL
jgi:hypothetical protein